MTTSTILESSIACALVCSVFACSARDDGTAATLGPAAGGGASVAGGGATGGSGVPASSAPGGLAGGSPITPIHGGGVAGGAQVTGTPFHQDDTTGSNIDKGILDGLRAGGSQCSAPLIYPYQGTVFPGGLVSPPLMWQGAADAAYLRVRYEGSDVVDYQFATGASNPGELRIPQDKWQEITRRAGTTNLLVTVNVKSGGNISSCQLKLRIARGNMVGALYYNTYNHPDAGGVGAILRLTLGQTAPQLYLTEPLGAPPMGPCISCHSVSANGSALAASTHLYFPAAFSAQSYAVSADPMPQARADLQEAGFGALTPDGTHILRMGNPDCTQGANAFPRATNNFPLVIGPTEPSLIDTATGQQTAASGLDPGHYMWMPQFSPDGRAVVFNDAKPSGSGGTDRTELAIMNYDPATRTFSNRRTLVTRAMLAAKGVATSSVDYVPDPIALALFGGLLTDVPGNACVNDWPADVGAIPGGSCSGPCYPAWPFFTPDGKGVVFSLISEPDFAVAFPGRDRASQSELWYVDLPSGAIMKMSNANKGLEPGDSLANYYPTVLPVQVGGYFWAFWTSTRDFGHRNLEAPIDAVATDILFGSTTSSEAFRKRIWVAAIRPSPSGAELGGTIDADPSFPGFYLEGQSETGNTRAFAALNPCRAEGNRCTSGLDCCTGFCNVEADASEGVCVEKMACAKTNERCASDADCCPPAGDAPQNSCVGGYCGFLVLN